MPGRYPHNTGIFRNVGPDGGFLAFRGRGHEGATFATALSGAGYRTAMLGKYLNGYLPVRHSPAPGWTTWAVAGNGYPGFNYNLNRDGAIAHYGSTPADYMTDVLADQGVRFIRQSAGKPFLLEIATFAPHAPYKPAPRDAEALPGVRAPRSPAFNAAPDARGPRWLLRHPPLSDADVAHIDRAFRMRAQAVLAVDQLIGELQAAVAAAGQASNTYFVFSSDNGYHMGEHRLMPGKMTAYDTDIHVPLVLTGPGVPPGRVVDQIVENVDLAATFVELAGTVVPAGVDGRSVVPLLRGGEVADWRTAALVEHRGPNRDADDPDLPGLRSGNPPTYEAMRTRAFLYVEYADGGREYHDLVGDPHELDNGFSSLSSARQAELHAALEAMRGCRGDSSCRSAGRVRAPAAAR